MINFNALGVSACFVESLARTQITVPTPIQEQVIPHALEGLDIVASAKTGSGKTLAYLLPLMHHLIQSAGKQALILLPTRELAIQVKDMLKLIVGKTPGFFSTVLIGGEPINKQIFQLKKQPQIIIGTPGRVYDHLKRNTLSLKKIGFLILDEMDRMLDVGFSVQIEKICHYLPSERQTMMFSATLPPHIEKLTHQYLRQPKRISVDSTVQAPMEIHQEIIHTSTSDKLEKLFEQLDQRQEGLILIFVKTKHGARKLALRLKNNNYNADAIHGDLQQNKRERLVQSFRQERTRIMVATDIASRGWDIPHIQHVINYDVPGCPEDYIHRIGRTGRAGTSGCAISLISPEDNVKWKKIHRFLNPAEYKTSQRSSGGKRASSSSFAKRGYHEGRTHRARSH